MYLKTVFITCLLLFQLATSLQKETVIQYVYTEVVGRADTPVETMTLNGVPVRWNDLGEDNVVLCDTYTKTKHDPFFVNSLQIILDSFNHTTSSNHTYQRLRQCQLHGYRVVGVLDQVQYDGTTYLILDRTTDAWTATVPQAKMLQQLWDSDKARTQRERMCLEKACTQLVKDLEHTEEALLEPERQAGMSFWLPVLAAVSLMVLIFVSFLFFKRQDSNISGYLGGAMGSIIHYPPNLSEVVQEQYAYHPF